MQQLALGACLVDCLVVAAETGGRDDLAQETEAESGDPRQEHRSVIRDELVEGPLDRGDAIRPAAIPRGKLGLDDAHPHDEDARDRVTGDAAALVDECARVLEPTLADRQLRRARSGVHAGDPFRPLDLGLVEPALRLVPLAEQEQLLARVGDHPRAEEGVETEAPELGDPGNGHFERLARAAGRPVGEVEVQHRSGDLVRQTRRARELEPAPDLDNAGFDQARRGEGRAEGDPTARLEFGGVGMGRLDGRAGDGDGLREPGFDHQDPGVGGHHARRDPIHRQVAQRVDRPRARLDDAGMVAAVPQPHSQAAEAGRAPAGVGGFLEATKEASFAIDRGVRLAASRGCPGAPFEQPVELDRPPARPQERGARASGVGSQRVELVDRAAPLARRVAEGEHGLGRLGRLDGRGQPGLHVTGSVEMVGELGGTGRVDRWRHPSEPVGDGPVEAATVGRRRVADDHLADQGVAQAVGLGSRIHGDQTSLGEQSQERGNVLWVQPRQLGDRGVAGWPVGHGEREGDGLGIGRQGGEAALHDVADRGRQRLVPAPGGKLLEEVRIAIGTVGETLDLAGRLTGPEQAAEQLEGRRPVDPAKLQPFDPVVPRQFGEERRDRVPAAEVVGSDGRDHQQPGAGQATDDEVEEVAGRSIAPLEVLDDDHDRPLLGLDLQAVDGLLEEPRSCGLPGEADRALVGRGQQADRTEGREEGTVRRPVLADHRARTCEDPGLDRCHELRDESRLADTGIAEDRDERRLAAVAGVLERLPEDLEFHPPTDEPWARGSSNHGPYSRLSVASRAFGLRWPPSSGASWRSVGLHGLPPRACTYAPGSVFRAPRGLTKPCDSRTDPGDAPTRTTFR